MPTTKVVIFDLDGTLLDTLEDLAAAVNHALAQRGLPQHTTGEYRAMVGHGVRNLVKQALPETAGDALIDAALADFKAYYSAHIDVRTRPYPGIPALLARLHARGIALAVASNKFQEGTERLIGKYFPGLPFVAILGNREGFPLKPDPAIVREVLQKAGATRSRRPWWAIRAPTCRPPRTAASAASPSAGATGRWRLRRNTASSPRRTNWNARS